MNSVGQLITDHEVLRCKRLKVVTRLVGKKSIGDVFQSNLKHYKTQQSYLKNLVYMKFWVRIHTIL